MAAEPAFAGPNHYAMSDKRNGPNLIIADFSPGFDDHIPKSLKPSDETILTRCFESLGRWFDLHVSFEPSRPVSFIKNSASPRRDVS